MIAAFNMDTEEDNINRYVLNPKESIGILNKGLEDFICVSSMQFFKRFKINTDFLTTDPSKWNDDEHFKKSTADVTNINVVNDIAERGVKLIEEYNTKFTNDETQKQYLLKVVCVYCNKYPDSKKNTILHKKF